MTKRWLTDFSPMRMAEVRLAVEFLGESASVELYGRTAVDVAMNAREGSPTTTMHKALFGARRSG